MKRLAAFSMLLALACRQEQPAQETPAPAPAATTTTAAPADPQAEWATWRENRTQRLQREDSWLTLVGLHWLKQGENTFGSAKSNDLVFTAKAPAKAGSFVLENGTVTLKPAAPMTIDGKPVEGPTVLAADTSIVHLGTLRFNVIKRGEKFAIRVKDPQSDVRTHFQGLQYYEYDPKWRVTARFEPYTPVKKIPITDITGMTAQNDAPGALVFDVDGKSYRLDPIDEGGDELFVIFRDETAKDTTYPAGRYLYVPKPGADNTVVVDFNKSYNPPCAFTDYATCPLPPQQNRLPVRIEAGEKKYAGGHA